MSSIPNALQEMQGVAHWVNFTYLQRGERRTKPPIDPKIDPKQYPKLKDRLAKPNDPATWGSYRQAVQRLRENKGRRYEGIGYVFGTDDPYCGVDLDKCRDPKTGIIQPWAQRIIKLLDSYTELSPSESGVHIIIRAKLVDVLDRIGRSHLQHRRGPIEIYDAERFFTITGKHLEGTPQSIESRSDELTQLYLETFPEEEKEEGEDKHEEGGMTTWQGPLSLSDQDIIERASRARGGNGERFQRLWNGDTSDYRDSQGNIDESRADLALLAILAYWTQKDPISMERLFKQSGLYHNRPERWNRAARSGETYGAGSIRLAIRNCHRVYDPAWAEQKKRKQAPASPPKEEEEQDPHHKGCENGRFPGTVRNVQGPQPFPALPTPAPAPSYLTLTPQEHRALITASNTRMQASIASFLETPAAQRKKLLLVSRPPGTGKTYTISQLGDPTQRNTYNIAAIFDRRDMYHAVPSLASYAIMEPCTKHNCDSAELANALAAASRNTWSVHRKHATMCAYGLQAQDQSKSKIYMLAHMRTKGPANHEAIWKDEADITRHITRKRFGIDDLRAEDTRCYAPTQTASMLLRALESIIAETHQEELTRRRNVLHTLKKQGVKVTPHLWQTIINSTIQLDSTILFDKLDAHAKGFLESWLGELANGDYSNTHPYVDIDPYDPNAMQQVEELPPVVLPYIARTLLAEFEDWQRYKRSGQAWNGHLRVGPGPKGYYIYVTDKLTFSPNGDGHTPPIIVSDGTISKKMLSLLYDIPLSDIEEDRERLPVAANTVLVEPQNAPRYGKVALSTSRTDSSGHVTNPDLDRAVGHARYLLRKYDPQFTALRGQKVGLISFKDCVEALGDALSIPKHRQMWFWGCRGSNALEDCSILLIIGTPAIRPNELVEYARDLYRRDPNPVSGETEPDPITGRLRYKDARVQDLAEHMTNGELEQCAHRIRPIQHEGKIIINLSHGTIGHMTGATIETEPLPYVLKNGKVRREANLEAAIRKLVDAYQQMQQQGTAITVSTLRQLAGVRMETARQWLADLRQDQSDVTGITITSFNSSSGNGLSNGQTPVSPNQEEEEVSSPPRVYPPLQQQSLFHVETSFELESPSIQVEGGIEPDEYLVMDTKTLPVLPHSISPSPVDAPRPPARACFHCGVEAWKWLGDRYACGNCSPDAVVSRDVGSPVER